MSDLLIQPLDDGESYDLIMFDGDCVRDESLRGAVIVSLFSDAEDPDFTLGERRGWWADGLSDDKADRTGSKLWLLQREKQTPDVLVRAKQYAKDALAWMLADGVASEIEVTASWGDVGRLDLEVDITGPTGQYRYRFEGIWAASLGDPLAVPNEIAGHAARLAARLGHIYYDPPELPELA
ncbi:MAG: phage GP46 family protein [Sinobacteraceae bacterium]|nr:phage GP46 family protein [Nevskiaceae bacterium]